MSNQYNVNLVNLDDPQYTFAFLKFMGIPSKFAEPIALETTAMSA
jgi:hypothetical protein